MITTTTESIEDKKIERYLGLVSGVDYYSIGGILGEGVTKTFGDAYSSGTFKGAREMMEENARRLGADAIVGVQMNTATGAGTGGRMYVYMLGTAVKLGDVEQEEEIPTL